MNLRKKKEVVGAQRNRWARLMEGTCIFIRNMNREMIREGRFIIIIFRKLKISKMKRNLGLLRREQGRRKRSIREERGRDQK